MSDCVFCKISAGEIPSTKVHEDDRFVAFLDLQPKAEHHALVIPREHHADLDAYVEAVSDPGEVLRFVAQTAKALGVQGRYRVIVNTGAAAGQTVFHLHWHVLAGDGLPGFT